MSRGTRGAYTKSIFTRLGREVSITVKTYSEPSTYWEPEDYEEEWDEDTLEFEGESIDPESWRGRIMMEALEKDYKAGGKKPVETKIDADFDPPDHDDAEGL